MRSFVTILAALAVLSSPALASENSRMAGTVPVSKKTQEAVAAKQQKTGASYNKKTKDTPQSHRVAAKAQQQAPAQTAAKPAENQKVAAASLNGVKPAVGTTKAAPEAEKPKVVPVVAKGPVNYVGEIKTYKANAEDTLLTIGEKFGLGYVELRSANPAMDPWRPGAGTFIVLPTMHLFPDAPRKGIVVNLAEMRMYHFTKNGVKTYPIGVGREGFSTPVGSTSVTRKTVGPVWTPTDRMRKEDPSLPAQVGPGPENPLGTHALYLGWPQYLLHGTNKPWGIGRRVSSGCVRMYNQDAENLYQTTNVGEPVTVVREGIKFGWVGDMLYIEAHPDEALADQVERVGEAQDYKVPADIFEKLGRAAGKSRDQLDWKAVREALKERRGYPVPILLNPKDDDYFVSASMATRAGTSRFGPRLTNEVVRNDVQQAQPQNVSADAPATPKRQHGFNG
ncbi:MAG: L,D-transpeptidase family protein [Alphaproteobacteria bacterium]|nr:L,D-transpeptidase family protein [Alphaproteobacteria bacterium]